MSTIVRDGQKIEVRWDSTPAFFVAVTNDYCGCDDCAGRVPVGWGKTEDEAVSDLLEQIEEAA